MPPFPLVRTSFWVAAALAFDLLAACTLSKPVEPVQSEAGASSQGSENTSGGSAAGEMMSTMGGGESGSCSPGQTASCWESPAGVPLDGDPNAPLGNCRVGVRTCSSEQTWGACEGAVGPLAKDECTPGDDSSCDGVVNDGCACTDGDERDCGTDEGNCQRGRQKCQGSAWGECQGQLTAAVKDSCDALDDANCNGTVNEGCACVNGTTRSCGSAIGNCQQGTQSCALGVWQPCQGSIEPSGSDSCSAGDDSDCDGVANEGCPCLEGSQEACGSSVGNCKKGTRRCLGGAWAACVGGVAAKPNDTCDSGDDSTCNGVANEGCTCINDATRTCGSSQGNCRQGTQTCSGGVWSTTCAGEVKKQAKDACTSGDDANCNGLPNEGCSCVVNESQGCGKCGTQTCTASGWGSCTNEGACSPGAVDEQVEVCPGECTNHKRKRTCSQSCTWGSWGSFDSVCQYQPNASKMCAGGDVYWYDSCGTKGSKVEECNTASCQAGACFRDCSGALTFDDPQFEAAVRLFVDKPSGALSWSDVSVMTLFNPSSVNVVDIKSLGGIECLTNLQIIDVGGNPISDLSPLRKGSTQLSYLAVWSDNVKDLSPLVDIPSLTYVDVTGNPLDCNAQKQYINTLKSRGATVLDDCN
jgi:hypothetical protein